MNKRKKRLLAAGLAVLLLGIAAFDMRLKVQTYTLDHPGVESPVRIALVTDLHACYYGKDQATLLEAIHSQAPDLVLLGGDMFDSDTDPKRTEQLLQGLADRYPIYAVTGNHDLYDGDAAVQYRMDLYAQYGVTLLAGQTEEVTVGGQTLLLGGLILST